MQSYALRIVFFVSLTLATVEITMSQDFQAVERRLGGAVEAGEISLHQAQIMMNALRESAEEAHKLQARQRKFAEFERQVRREHQAGEISEREAGEMLEDMHRELFEGRHQHHEREHRERAGREREHHERDHHEREHREREHRERAGHEREHHEREHHEREHQAEMEKRKRHFEHLKREIMLAVEAGQLSEEEAERKIDAILKELFPKASKHKDRPAAHEDSETKHRKYEQAARHIKELMQAGQLSEQDAREKLRSLKQMIFGSSDGQSSKERMFDSDRQFYEDSIAKIKAAVADGKLSKDEAEKKFEFIYKKILKDERGENDKLSSAKKLYNDLTRKIKAAAEAGLLSEKEARQKLNAIQKNMSGKVEESQPKRRSRRRKQ